MSAIKSPCGESGIPTRTSRSHGFPALAAAVAALQLGGSPVAAQDPFGAQQRADAVSRMLVLGIQQGISSLPPTAGQSFSYVFDPELATLVPGDAQLEPVSLRSTQMTNPGSYSIRLAASALHLRETFGPEVYEAQTPDGSLFGFTEFGSGVEARVALLNAAVNYGVRERLEIGINAPVVWADVSAWQTFTTPQSLAFLPPADARVGGGSSLQELEDLKKIASDLDPETDGLVYRSDGYDDLGLRFDDGAHVGLGRVSLSGKYLLVGRETLQVASMLELFLPSPNEDEYSGSNTFSMLPRLIIRHTPSPAFRLHGDIGYEGDFEAAELRRFVWNTGVSVPGDSFVVDVGFGGSVFEESIRWSPQRASSAGDTNVPPLEISALGSTKIGNVLVDALMGFKVRLRENVLASVAISLPINDEGLRSDIVGTFGLEVHP